MSVSDLFNYSFVICAITIACLTFVVNMTNSLRSLVRLVTYCELYALGTEFSEEVFVCFFID